MLYCKFSGDYNSEKIFKIGQYLRKLCVENLGLTFLAHPVYQLNERKTFTCRNVLAPGALERNSLATIAKRKWWAENTAASQNWPTMPVCNDKSSRWWSLSGACVDGTKGSAKDAKAGTTLLHPLGEPDTSATRHFGIKTLWDTSAPQNWCRRLRRITGGAVSHRNCPGSKWPGFSSITAVVSKCLVPRFWCRSVETGAEVSQSVLMPKYLVTEVSGNSIKPLLQLWQNTQLASYSRSLLHLRQNLEGWVNLGGWLHTEMVYLPTDSHPSKK